MLVPPRYQLLTYSNMKRLLKGFTFVELMVVMAIAAMTFSAIAVTFTSVNKKSRDSRRRADIESIRQALELCRSYSGNYPQTIVGTITCGGQVYMTSVPKDPKDGATLYTYTPAPGPNPTYSSYTISTARMEDTTTYPGGAYSATNP